MTLAEVLSIALAAYDEDDAEREAVLEKLRWFVFIDRQIIINNLTRAWHEGWEDEIRAAVAEYRTERAAIDREIEQIEQIE
jgi:hypothetical protein